MPEIPEVPYLPLRELCAALAKVLKGQGEPVCKALLDTTLPGRGRRKRPVTLAQSLGIKNATKLAKQSCEANPQEEIALEVQTLTVLLVAMKDCLRGTKNQTLKKRLSMVTAVTRSMTPEFLRLFNDAWFNLVPRAWLTTEPKWLATLPQNERGSGFLIACLLEIERGVRDDINARVHPFDALLCGFLYGDAYSLLTRERGFLRMMKAFKFPVSERGGREFIEMAATTLGLPVGQFDANSMLRGATDRIKKTVGLRQARARCLKDLREK